MEVCHLKKLMLLVLAAGMLFLPLAACAGEEQEPITSSPAALQESSQNASSALKKTEPVSQTESGVSSSAGSSGAVPAASAAQEDTLLEIVVNGQTFLADFEDTQAAESLAEMLPISLSMTDWQGAAKQFSLPSEFPIAEEVFSSMRAGQLVLEDTSTLCLFYQNSDEGGSYTPLAVVRDPEGLSQAMAGETAAISFQMVTG